MGRKSFVRTFALQISEGSTLVTAQTPNPAPSIPNPLDQVPDMTRVRETGFLRFTIRPHMVSSFSDKHNSCIVSHRHSYGRFPSNGCRYRLAIDSQHTPSRSVDASLFGNV